MHGGEINREVTEESSMLSPASMETGARGLPECTSEPSSPISHPVPVATKTNRIQQEDAMSGTIFYFLIDFIKYFCCED